MKKEMIQEQIKYWESERNRLKRYNKNSNCYDTKRENKRKMKLYLDLRRMYEQELEKIN